MVIVTADADGQLAVTDIDRVAHAAKRLSNRLICRYSSIYQRPLSSHFGNKLKRVLFHLQRGVKVSNTQTGLLVFHTDLIPFILTIEDNRYEYKMNILTLPSKRYNITEVLIETIYIDDSASSHFRTVRDEMMMYNNLFKFALTSIFLTSAPRLRQALHKQTRTDEAGQKAQRHFLEFLSISQHSGSVALTV